VTRPARVCQRCPVLVTTASTRISEPGCALVAAGTRQFQCNAECVQEGVVNRGYGRIPGLSQGSRDSLSISPTTANDSNRDVVETLTAFAA
jgi:hypothetical protein